VSPLWEVERLESQVLRVDGIRIGARDPTSTGIGLTRTGRMSRAFSAGLEGVEYSGALHRAANDHAPLALKKWKRLGVSGKIRERRKGAA
jgi:hypothetical protein